VEGSGLGLFGLVAFPQQQDLLIHVMGIYFGVNRSHGQCHDEEEPVNEQRLNSPPKNRRVLLRGAIYS